MIRPSLPRGATAAQRWRFALAPTTLAFGLGAAGLPVWVLAPLALANRAEVPAAQIGLALVALRLLDVAVQVAIGRLGAGAARASRPIVWAAWSGMSGAALVLALPPAGAPLAWFVAAMAALAASRGVLAMLLRASDALADAARREGAMLTGTALGLAGPVAMIVLPVPVEPHLACALALVASTGAALTAMPAGWARLEGGDGGSPLADPAIRRILWVTLLGATPFAAAPALVLAYAEDRLAASGAGGALLILVTLAAALSAPLWGRVARGWGAARALVAGLALGLAAMACALPLGEGQVVAFAAAGLVSGVAWGAHRVLTLTLLARRLAELGAARRPARAYAWWAGAEAGAGAVGVLAALAELGATGAATGAHGGLPAPMLLAGLLLGAPLAAHAVALALLARR